VNEFLTNLKQQAQDNPAVALAAGATLLGGVAKFVSALVAMNNSHAWKKEVARRARKDGV
jgi:hypothetical protein